MVAVSVRHATLAPARHGAIPKGTEVVGFEIGVFATITDGEGRVLLVHRTDCDWWCQPGGVLERGEAPWAGVAREVREETGLEVTGERLAGV